MTEEERMSFKRRLETLAEELKADLVRAAPSKESITPDNAIGRLTRMEAIQAQAMMAEGRRRQQVRLRQVERALARLDKGTYGSCIRCGAEIRRGRLELMPEAPLCMACAARQR